MKNFDLTKKELAPLTINQYNILQTFQQSGNGTRATFLGQDSQQEKKILKEFKFLNKSNWSDFNLIQKELKTLERLDHPNIPKVIETFEFDNGLYLVIEYISGKSLEKQDLCLEKVISFCKSMLNILVYLQKENVIHRDIKPQNIILGDDGNFHLIDFGISTSTLETIQGTGIVVGTRGFMPPELFRTGKLDKSADLYSLGATIFCLLTKTNSIELLALIDSRNILSLNALDKRVSGQFLNWLSRCLEPDPQDRFPNAVEAESAFDKISSFKPTNIPKHSKIKKKKSKLFNLKTFGCSILGLVILAALAYAAVIAGKHIITFVTSFDWNTLISETESGNSPEADISEFSLNILRVLKFFLWLPPFIFALLLPIAFMNGENGKENIMPFFYLSIVSFGVSVWIPIIEDLIL